MTDEGMEYEEWLMHLSFEVGREAMWFGAMFDTWADLKDPAAMEGARTAIAKKLYRDLAVGLDIPDDDPRRKRDLEHVMMVVEAMERQDSEGGTFEQRFRCEARDLLVNLVGVFVMLNMRAAMDPWPYITDEDKAKIEARMRRDIEENGHGEHDE